MSWVDGDGTNIFVGQSAHGGWCGQFRLAWPEVGGVINLGCLDLIVKLQDKFNLFDYKLVWFHCYRNIDLCLIVHICPCIKFDYKFLWFHFYRKFHLVTGSVLNAVQNKHPEVLSGKAGEKHLQRRKRRRHKRLNRRKKRKHAMHRDYCFCCLTI